MMDQSTEQADGARCCCLSLWPSSSPNKINNNGMAEEQKLLSPFVVVDKILCVIVFVFGENLGTLGIY
jgi:hypothetical protein